MNKRLETLVNAIGISDNVRLLNIDTDVFAVPMITENELNQNCFAVTEAKYMEAKNRIFACYNNIDSIFRCKNSKASAIIRIRNNGICSIALPKSLKDYFDTLFFNFDYDIEYKEEPRWNLKANYYMSDNNMIRLLSILDDILLNRIAIAESKAKGIESKAKKRGKRK